jgi:endoglucanase
VGGIAAIYSFPEGAVHGMRRRLPGVIGCKAFHVMKEDERRLLITYDKMFIDTGATKEQLESYGIKVGTPITFDRKLTELENGLLVGKAMDDRAGCYALVDALKRANQEQGRLRLYGSGGVGLRGVR